VLKASNMFLFFEKNPKHNFAGNFWALFMQFTHGNFCVNQNGADL